MLFQSVIHIQLMLVKILSNDLGIRLPLQYMSELQYNQMVFLKRYPIYNLKI